MRKVLATCLFFFLLCSCLRFDGQVVYFFHDKQKDELRLLILYNGITSNDEIDESKKELTEFIKSDWEIVLHSWPCHIKKVDIEKSMNDPGTLDIIRKNVTLLLKDTTVTNGQFFLDSDKRVCGSQAITIKNISKHIKFLNALMSNIILLSPASLRYQDPKAQPDERLLNKLKFNGKTLELLAAPAHQNHQWIKLDGQSIQLSFPISDEDLIRIKTILLEELKKCGEKPYKDALYTLAQNEISFSRNGKFVTLELGNKGANGPVRVLVKPNQGDYKNNLNEFITEKFGISLKLTEETVMDQFISSLVNPDVAKKIEDLIQKLGSDNFETRENATKELIEMGGLATPWVRKAIESKDAEVRIRAKQILKQ